jgi:hypothetical protein
MTNSQNNDRRHCDCAVTNVIVADVWASDRVLVSGVSNGCALSRHVPRALIRLFLLSLIAVAAAIWPAVSCRHLPLSGPGPFALRLPHDLGPASPTPLLPLRTACYRDFPPGPTTSWPSPGLGTDDMMHGGICLHNIMWHL